MVLKQYNPTRMLGMDSLFFFSFRLTGDEFFTLPCMSRIGYCNVTNLVVRLERDDSDEGLQLLEGILSVHFQHIFGLRKHDLHHNE